MDAKLGRSFYDVPFEQAPTIGMRSIKRSKAFRRSGLREKCLRVDFATTFSIIIVTYLKHPFNLYFFANFVNRYTREMLARRPMPWRGIDA